MEETFPSKTKPYQRRYRMREAHLCSAKPCEKLSRAGKRSQANHLGTSEDERKHTPDPTIQTRNSRPSETSREPGRAPAPIKAAQGKGHIGAHPRSRPSHPSRTRIVPRRMRPVENRGVRRRRLRQPQGGTMSTHTHGHARTIQSVRKQTPAASTREREGV